MPETKEDKFLFELMALMSKHDVHLSHEQVPSESHGEWSSFDIYSFVGPTFAVNVASLI